MPAAQIERSLRNVDCRQMLIAASAELPGWIPKSTINLIFRT
jgi:hypothetical protein